MIGGSLRMHRGKDIVIMICRPAGDIVRAEFRLCVALSIPLLGACAGDTLLGFKIGDIGGLWIASSYEHVSTANPSLRVDIVARDGALLTLSVDDSVQPPVVGSTLDDGLGAPSNRSGAVDIRQGLLTLGAETYVVVHDNDRMTLTNESGAFDFGNGVEPATIVISLDRI